MVDFCNNFFPIFAMLSRLFFFPATHHPVPSSSPQQLRVMKTTLIAHVQQLISSLPPSPTPTYLLPLSCEENSLCAMGDKSLPSYNLSAAVPLLTTKCDKHPKIVIQATGRDRHCEQKGDAWGGRGRLGRDFFRRK